MLLLCHYILVVTLEIQILTSLLEAPNMDLSLLAVSFPLSIWNTELFNKVAHQYHVNVNWRTMPDLFDH